MKNKLFQPDRIGSYFRAEWLPLALVTVSGLIYNVGLLAAPWFEGRLAQCLADILGGNETAAQMAMLVLAYIAVTLLVQAARFIKRFYVRRFANNINRRMKGILYANLVRQSRAALEQEGAGELMTKAISDVDDCVEGMRKFTTEVFDTGVALAGYAVMLLVYDWRLALLSLLFTPVSYVCAAWMKKPVQRAGAAYKKAAGALSAATLDRAQNAVTYRIYGCESAREERYESALDTYEKTAVRSNVWQSALPPLYLAVSGAGTLFILWFGAKNVLGTGWNTWDIAAFTTFLSCFTKLTVKSSKVAKLFNAVQKAEVSWKRIQPLMKKPEELPPLAVPAPADVTLEGLSFSYGDTPVFSGLTLTAHPGDIIGVTGPVACGKSTLGRVFLCEAPYGGSAKFGEKELSSLTPWQVAATVGYLGHDSELSADTVRSNVLCGDEQDAMPYLAAVALEGEVRAMENGPNTVIGGADVSAIPDGQRRARIGCVEQHFSRVPGTVLEQITLNDPQITREMAQNAAKLAGIDEAIQALPEGYDTVCTDGMFSQGEWQLLSIARAAAADPAVLLLDEITANLDAETEERVLDALRQASQGRTVLSVSHRVYENLGDRTVEIKPQTA